MHDCMIASLPTAGRHPCIHASMHPSMPDSFLSAFIDYLRYEKRMSPHTLSAYTNDLRQFFSYLKNTYSVSDSGIKEISHFMIRSWLMSLIEKKITARSVNRKISTLKSFYKFLLREKAISASPMSKILSPKTPKRLPVFIEENKMNLLLEKEFFKDNFEGKRNRLLVELLYSTGIRRAELIHLKESDIDFQNNTLKVLGKRNKERMIPFTSHLKKIIQEYLEEKHKISGNDFLFVSKKGKQMNPVSVHQVVTKTLGKITTLSKKSPHVLRHTFATHLLNNGADINAIKELLGHANLAATQVYTHNTIEKLKSVYLKAHPKA